MDTGVEKLTVLQATLRFVLKLVFRLLFRVNVEGDIAALAAERLLIVANHESIVDGLLLGLFLPVNPLFVVHTDVMKNRFYRLVLFFTDYLVVDQRNPLAIKKVLRLIGSGRPIVIFPEGRITLTGSLMKVYDGPAFIAARTGATIVPVRLDGPARSYFSRLSGNYPHSLFPHIRICIQPPTHISLSDGNTAKARRRKAGEAMRRIMQDMLFHSQPRQTLVESLIETMRTYGPRRKVVEDIREEPISYRQLLKLSFAVGRALSQQTEPGERVGVLLPNLAPTVGAVFGLSVTGRCAAMLNHTSGQEGMQNACSAAAIRTILTSHAFLEKAGIAQQAESLQGVRLTYLEDVKASLSAKDKLWVLAVTAFPRILLSKGDPESPAVVLFTSGSEGKPKGVVLSHRALLANIAQVRAVIDMQPTDRVFNALPMFHSFGLTGGTLMPILTGMTVFLYPSPLHYRIIPELIYDKSCTLLFGTNTFLGNYAKFAHPYDFYRLRYVVAGAEKVTENVRSAWVEKFGIRILDGYGATETAPVLAVNTPMAFRKGSVGQILPGIESRIVPVPGIEHGGMLHVRGPNLMSGYLRSERPGVIEPPRSALGDAWYETGDVVEQDADGFISIIGRVKRFAKIAGEMVSLELVEKIAASASRDRQHAATAFPDHRRGESIVLFTTDQELTRGLLQQAASAGGFPEIAVPRSIIAVEALPLLGTGKVDYVSLQKMAEAA
jgi:acyl-[acyl-carrier-protein]-phospholipid O-acyltransferase / long-chain-fatty-acid--[acyl-carrier-protein] ligase